MTTTRTLAAAIHVGPRTREFDIRDEYGFVVRDAGLRNERVLAALGRADLNGMPDGEAKSRCLTVAYALRKCIVTGRLNPAAALRITVDYTPYQVCALVARICRECPETTIGDICDTWLIRNHATL